MREQFGKLNRIKGKKASETVEKLQPNPAAQMKFLRSFEDEELKEALDNWEEIRAHQESGNGTSDDYMRLQELLGHINTRLSEHGKKSLTDIKDLP